MVFAHKGGLRSLMALRLPDFIEFSFLYIVVINSRAL